MKTFLIRIQRPDTPAWIIDKKGQLIEVLKQSSVDSVDSLEMKAEKHQGSLDILPVMHEHCRELTLPSKNFEQFKKMVPHQIRGINPSAGQHQSWIYECLELQNPEPHQNTAIVLAHHSEKWHESSDQRPKSESKHDGQMSETLALLHAYKETLQQGDHDHHIFHQHQETLWHLYQLSGDLSQKVIHADVCHFTIDDHQEAIQGLARLVQQSHQWQTSESIHVHLNHRFGKSLQKEFIELHQAQPLAFKSGRSPNHDELLLYGASRVIQETSQCPKPFDEHSQGHSDSASQSKIFQLLGVSLLFFLGTCWTSNMIILEQSSEYSQKCLRYLQNIHKQTLPTGQRRSFSEMTLVKRLNLAAKSSKQKHESEASFMNFFNELQAHLQRCPDFQCQRLQSQTHEGQFQIQGLVSSVHHFDELTSLFQENKKWKVQSNFTRSSGSKSDGFKVNLSIQVLP
jgi:hypothetical protein